MSDPRHTGQTCLSHSLVLGAMLLCLWGQAGCERAAPAPATQPATQPATSPATRPQSLSYIDLARETYPRLAATQPLERPASLDQAGHILLTDPVYLCPRGDLWITHPEGEPAARILADAAQQTVHLVRETVAYVHWRPLSGRWTPSIVVAAPDGGYELLAGASRLPLPADRGWRWDRALSWGERIIVPVDDGICLLTAGAQQPESSYGFRMHQGAVAPQTAPASQPAMSARNPCALAFDSKGFLAWIPSEPGRLGSVGAVRFVSDQWMPLGPDQSWPPRVLHLAPLLDGSVLRFALDEDDRLELSLQPLDAAAVDQAQVARLVDELSDPAADVRDRAFGQLTLYGPGVWPLLEQLREDQPAEAQARLDQLLAARTQPTLGGMTLVDGRVVVADRLTDGGIVLHAPGGVRIADRGAPSVILHAWISVRPGEPIRLMDEDLTADARPGRQRMFAWRSEWLIWDAAAGMRRLMGNHLAPMLREDERGFGDFVGVGRGRWVFRDTEDASRTLILDPSVPDPTPRLPVWVMDVGQQAGWDDEDWPAIKSGGAWSLREKAWSPIDLGTHRFIDQWTAPPALKTGPAPPATTRASEVDLGPPLLVAGDGTRYYGGGEWLLAIGADGRELRWDLPPEAVGQDRPTLIEAGEARLFLFNAPGRVLRIRPTPGQPEPFDLEATFTRGIPSSRDIRRIWLDPAGRIVVAHDGTRLAILFPDARVPREIGLLIPAGALVE